MTGEIEDNFEPINDNKLKYSKEEIKPFSLEGAYDVVEDKQLEIGKERLKTWLMQFALNYIFGGKTMYDKIFTNWKSTLAGVIGGATTILLNTWVSGQPITLKGSIAAIIPVLIGALSGDQHKEK